MSYLDDFRNGDLSKLRNGQVKLAGGIFGLGSQLRQLEAADAARNQQANPNLTRAQQSLAWIQNLPGRQAAGQTGKYNGWNALADMLGAYWRVNGQGQAAQDAGTTGRLFGDGAHTAFNNAANEIMPEIDWLKQNG